MQKENQRVMLTKRLLKESLIRLMEEKEIQKISVSELCRDAGINRVTFYNHYTSPQDLLREMERELVAEIHNLIKQKRLDQSPKIKERIEVTCDYLNRNRKVAKLIFKNNTADSKFTDELFRVPKIWDKMCLKLSAAYGEEGKDLLTTFITRGTYSVIQKWLLNDMNKTPHEMGEIINAIYLKGYLE